MKHFINTSNQNFTFSSCSICEANCCDGRKGTIFSQIILEDFSQVYKNFPILFIFGELGYLKPVVILTNGKTFCNYLKDFKCNIYENRPSVCRTYPLSSNLDDNTYIDELCPAVNSEKNAETIINEDDINKNFDFHTLHNYQDKYIDTFQELDIFNKKEDFSIALEIKGLIFFKYNKDSENKYMQMHQDSLVHLQKSYFL